MNAIYPRCKLSIVYVFQKAYGIIPAIELIGK